MNIFNPVKDIMTTKLITVGPHDKLETVKAIFEQNNIHHVPVVRYKEILGMISKSDFLYFLRGFSGSDEDRFIDNARLRVYNAEDIMTTGLAKISPNDRISVALEIFLQNRFHAVPIVENEDLVGMVTTLDILRKLAENKFTYAQMVESNAKIKE